ncbi:hypothetical protein ACFU8Q_15430 [Streptomyces sp. NPDC057543]|uniref:hypothetical protein n=1 Tax=Streptomyces sp. NPDC057543 TaxID=3346163 RepID=UPI0036CD8FE7
MRGEVPRPLSALVGQLGEVFPRFHPLLEFGELTGRTAGVDGQQDRVPGVWDAVEAEAGWGTWAALRRG